MEPPNKNSCPNMWQKTTPSATKNDQIVPREEQKDLPQKVKTIALCSLETTLQVDSMPLESRRSLETTLQVDSMPLESRRLTPIFEDHLDSFLNRAFLNQELHKVLGKNEYPRTFKGWMPLAVNTNFSFGKLTGFHPIYLTRIFTVYLLEEGGKSWLETRQIQITDPKFKQTGISYSSSSTLTWKTDLSGQQNVAPIEATLATSVKRWGLQRFSSIAKKKEFKEAVAEGTLAFAQLKDGRVTKIHVHEGYCGKLKGHNPKAFVFEKHYFLFMPMDYETIVYDDERYQTLIQLFNRSV